jgi:hypothetical protein
MAQASFRDLNQLHPKKDHNFLLSFGGSRHFCLFPLSNNFDNFRKKSKTTIENSAIQNSTLFYTSYSALCKWIVWKKRQ